MKKRLLVLLTAIVMGLTMTAAPVFAGGYGNGDGKDKEKVYCKVKHKGHYIVVPKKAALKHKEQHGDKIIKCFKK
jgi:hypothetical protein